MRDRINLVGRWRCLYINKDKYPFIHQYNDAPILSVKTLKEWAEKIDVQTNQSITINYNKRDDAYWRDISFL